MKNISTHEAGSVSLQANKVMSRDINSKQVSSYSDVLINGSSLVLEF